MTTHHLLGQPAHQARVTLGIDAVTAHQLAHRTVEALHQLRRRHPHR
ncbi:hypothetical protein [Marmoricola endophyticus]|nr:hypothetical protein [Marmoricola endophyticus]